MSVRNRCSRDRRITIKIDRAMGKAIETRIRDHPEWGVASISEFIRRAIDRELQYRDRMTESKVLELEITSGAAQGDTRGRGP